ncbi:MAG: hypothetical protein ACRD2L_06305 [Terriglobia bacterium]
MKTLPVGARFRISEWAGLDPSERLGVFQEYEYRLAQDESRDPCELELIPREVLTVGDNGENLFGQYLPAQTIEGAEVQPERIQLNPRLLQSGTRPYEAVETYFEEARHAYQMNVAEHPELAETPQYHEDCIKAKNGGYLNPSEFPWVYYRSQPAEVDAKHVAQTRTMMTYEQLGELDGYLDHMESPTYERQRAAFAYEKAYEQPARELVDKRYEIAQKRTEAQRVQEGEDYSYGPSL